MFCCFQYRIQCCCCCRWCCCCWRWPCRRVLGTSRSSWVCRCRWRLSRSWLIFLLFSFINSDEIITNTNDKFVNFTNISIFSHYWQSFFCVDSTAQSYITFMSLFRRLDQPSKGSCALKFYQIGPSFTFSTKWLISSYFFENICSVW